jgi:hypothetical protein
MSYCLYLHILDKLSLQVKVESKHLEDIMHVVTSHWQVEINSIDVLFTLSNHLIILIIVLELHINAMHMQELVPIIHEVHNIVLLL